MWLLYALVHMFFMALVNYLDEWLTHSSSTAPKASIHERVGGVILMSTMLCAMAAIVLYAWQGGDITLPSFSLWLAFGSAIPLVAVWVIYFYLFQSYSAHQVIPLFGLASIWLLAIEIASGVTPSWQACGGLLLLLVGAYINDNKGLKWSFPSRLLYIMLGNSLLWALSSHMVKMATATQSVISVSFWQFFGACLLGLAMFLLITPYRRGFLGRLRAEGRQFVAPSILNESCGQTGVFFGVLAIAAAPMAVYFTAVVGVQGLILMLLMYLFPLHQRNTITQAQWIGASLIALGVATLELYG